jgi:L-ribulose-5-phosphate 4-epimerase
VNHAELRQQLVELHLELPRNDLVAWTSGNVSARVNDDELLIKPSGLRFCELTPESMVHLPLEGEAFGNQLKPSSDAATHAYIYRHLPRVGGIVHTHSPYATAWAAVGREIPCVLTAMADEFGGPIPVGGFALIGGEEIGQEVVRVLEHHPSPAVLMRNHGVFAIGPTPEAAVKAAVMCEDVAKTVFLAYQLGTPLELPEGSIEQLHHRYQNIYGQR